MGSVREETVEVPGWAEDPWPVVVRVAEAPDGSREAAAPVVWVHGVPTASDDWLPFLERAGGVAFDWPGFGRSSKRGDGDFTIDGYARFFGAFVDAMGFARIRLVVHDWGAAALVWAAAHPERIERLVVLDAVPLLEGYTWHRWARTWRTRGLGEVAMGLAVGPVVRLIVPRPVADVALAHLDQGTQRAILRLYRSAPPSVLASHEPSLAALADVPSLVIWGQEDPYITSKFASRYAEALGGATVQVLPSAGHWPWVEDRTAVDAVVDFIR